LHKPEILAGIADDEGSAASGSKGEHSDGGEGKLIES
jgi:hypothetical protein